MKIEIKKANPICTIIALTAAASFVLAGCSSSGTQSTGRGGAGSSLTEATEAVSEVTEAASETETTVYEIPADFGEGYIKADYAVYTAEDKEKGDKIWLSGTAIEAGTVEDGEIYEFCTVLKDADGNQWLLILDKTDSESEIQKFDDNYDTNGMAVAGIYMGMSENNVPVIIAHKWFLVAEGTVHISEAFGDAEYTVDNSDTGSSKEASGSETSGSTASGSTASVSAGSSDSTAKDSGSKRTGISDDFKKAMDEYEAFFDEYCDFLKNYDPSDSTQLMKYLSFLEQYSETMEAFEAWEDEDMTDEEALYYAEVNLRIEKKLLEAAQ